MSNITKVKAEHLLNHFQNMAEKGLKKIEYYQLKSNAKDKKDQINSWRSHTDVCLETIEILEDYLRKC